MLKRSSTMKRFVFLLIALSLLCLSLAANAAPPPSEKDENFTYYFVNDTITIGAYTGEGGAVTLPSTYKDTPITAIDGYTFQYCETLTELIIPEGYTYIGAHAFQGCQTLTSVHFPASLTYIANGAFQN